MENITYQNVFTYVRLITARVGQISEAIDDVYL